MSSRSKKVHWFLRACFILAVLATLFFGIRTTLSAIYWNNPDHTDQTIEGWMPLGYIGRSWGIPRSVMQDALSNYPGVGPGNNIEEIARNSGVSNAELIAHIMAAITSYREQNGG